jgi:hypothetical protein
MRKAYVYVRLHNGGAIVRENRTTARIIVEGLKTGAYTNRRAGRAYEKTEAADRARIVARIEACPRCSHWPAKAPAAAICTCAD